MRTIKFRGRRIDNGEWVYGYFVGTTDSVAIIIPFEKVNYDVGYIGDSECCYCLPETIGQFTGLFDKNGNEIYEGDILVWGENGYKSTPLIAMFKHGAFGYTYIEDWFHSFAGNTNFTFNPLNTDIRFEIIGNIHDNPELLKGGNKWNG